jgi:putative hydrolase of the HAD superfamily
MKPVKLVLFDLDDTLFDHQHCYRTGLEVLIREDPYFSRKTLEQLEDHYDRNLEDLHARVLQGLMTLEEARNERFRRLLVWCGGPDCVDTGRAIAERFRAVYIDARRPVPGALGLLTALKPRVKIGIVTNNVTEEQKEKLLHCALHDVVDFMVTSEEVEEPKPGGLIFRTALERGGAEASEAVMVGDSWASDVMGAAGAGIRAVWFNRNGRPIPEPGLAEELTSFEPVEEALRVLLSG